MNKDIQIYKETHTIANIYASSIRLGKLEHFQLEPGKFEGSNCQVISENVMVAMLRSNRTLLESGYGAEGFTFFLLPGNIDQDFSWRKQRLTGTRLGLLKSQMQHYAVIPPDFFGTPIGISNELLKKLILDLDVKKNLFKLIQQTEVVEIEGSDATRIQKMVIDLCKTENPSIQVLAEQLPVLVLKSIEKVSDRFPIQISGHRDISFSKAFQFIQQNIKSEISVKMLCEHLDMSERGLRYIFKDLTGLAPKRFIKSIRLNMTRKDILANVNRKKIATMASNWGFNHSGQFAADYHALFGEHPSETALNKKAI